MGPADLDPRAGPVHPVVAAAQRREIAEAQPQRHLTGALQARLTALQPGHIAQRHLELEDLLAGHHPLVRWDRRSEAVQHRGLAGLGATGDEDVQAASNRAGKKR